MNPEFPLISIYKNRGLNIFTDDSKFRIISTYTFINQDPNENSFYDKYGKKWTFIFVNEKIKNNLITRLLANTFYNPNIGVDFAVRFRQS